MESVSAVPSHWSVVTVPSSATSAATLGALCPRDAGGKVTAALHSLPLGKACVLEGLRLYDISRDSTQGGVGPQRFADPATWGGDGDFLPAVQIYNLLRGITYNGQWFYGLQNLSSSRLPAAAWIAQIEKHRADAVAREQALVAAREAKKAALMEELKDQILPLYPKK